ncbi:hypothetical protein ABZ896_12150 [Streptomyces sp. NPDC047072]|uniref:hypothetical protein n=1 Tax=Streptomyces sp. NPDC047072 TaxID=3154809 RepID=UPI0033D5EA15
MRGVRIERSGRCRELTASAGVLAATLTLLMWGAPAASAGGPTSVLVVSPESGETAALYYSDEKYSELQRWLDPATTGMRDKPPEANLLAARQINVTWMAHDVSPWRLDRVFPMADGKEVWIHTAEHVPESVNGQWRRADHPARLRALLTNLGVMGETTGEGHGIFPAPEPEAGDDSGAVSAETGASAAPASTSASASASVGDDGVDWWWGLPGLGAGAGLALGLRPFVLRLPWERLRRERGPRQELRDV